MSRARDLADLGGSADAGGLTGRNIIINGAMQVWQRGTSSSSAGYGSADRWSLNLSGGTATASQQSFAIEQEDIPFNPQYYLNLNVTTGNDNCGLHYKHEGTHEFDNKTLTLSFYAKSSNARQLTVQFQTVANGATEIVNHTVTSSTFTPTSSWQRYTFTITAADMSGVRAYAGNDYTRIIISQYTDTSTSAWQLDIVGIQLEVGETATPFEHRSYGDELARCQRYYQKLWFRSYNIFTDYTGNQYATQSLVNPIRTDATVTNSGSTGANITITLMKTVYDTALEIQCSSSGTHNNWVTADIYVDAEL
jgi:hypothetical protein